MQLIRGLRDERGMSLIELMVTGFLASILLTALGAFLISSFRAGAFTEGQSATINDVRNAMQMIEKEVRGAEHFDWCAPPGSCIEVTFESRILPHPLRQARYEHGGTDLLRREREQDPVTGSWSDWSSAQTVIQRVHNTVDQPVFACDTQSTFLRVTVDLRIEPTPHSQPTLNAHTSIRPRNYPSVATCP